MKTRLLGLPLLILGAACSNPKEAQRPHPEGFPAKDTKVMVWIHSPEGEPNKPDLMGRVTGYAGEFMTINLRSIRLSRVQAWQPQ
tara:strand:- start:473 stop:727 length:255 start_codon:yes stop_codon:yes gene_type:complete